jgi:urocanate hydratase
MLTWDVSNGLARRAWARNPGAVYAAKKAMEAHPTMAITLPVEADPEVVAAALLAARPA